MKEAFVVFCNGIVGVFTVMFILYGTLRLLDIVLRLFPVKEND